MGRKDMVMIKIKAVLFCLAMAFMATAFLTLDAKAGNDTAGSGNEGDAVTFLSYRMYTYRDESMGAPPNGTEGMDGCHLVIEAEFGDVLTLTDADAAADSFVMGDHTSVMGFSNQTVTVNGRVMTLDALITYMPGGVIRFSTSTVEGLECGGKAVYWPEDFCTVVPTGLSFHVVDVTVGTTETPASTTIKIDRSVAVRSMNHILWTSNGSSILEGVGTAQTTAAHHHNYWGFTLGDSAKFIKASAPSDASYSISCQDDTVTIAANTAVEGEYLGVYNYDDDFLQKYGFTLQDEVTGLPRQEAIEGLDIAKRCTVTMPDSMDWTGSALTPEVTVVDGFHHGVSSYPLVENVDYTVSYENNVDWKSTATVRITGLGDYAGSSVEKTFRITKPLSKEMFDVDTGDEEFKAAAYTKTVTPLTGLRQNIDYSVLYLDNAFPGDSTVAVSGMGDYSGTLTYTFHIYPKSITKEMFTVDIAEKTYTGSAIEPVVTSSLRKNAEYKVTYANNVNPGTGTVTIVGTGNYTGALTYDFAIKAADSAAAAPTVLAKEMFTVDTKAKTYTGKAQKTNISSSLEQGKDFTVSYAGNKKVGTAVVTVKGIGNYTGNLTYTFKIKLAKATITKASAGKKKLKLRWSDTGAGKYKVYYRVKGTSKWKTKTVKTNKATLSSLKKGKKYQVKVVSVKGSDKTASKVKLTAKIK